MQVFSFGINPFRATNRVESKTGSSVFLGDDLVATNFHVILDATVMAVGRRRQRLRGRARWPRSRCSTSQFCASQRLVQRQIEPIEFAPSDELAIGQPAPM